MKSRTGVDVVRQVEAVFLDGMLGTWSDDRLLDRFAGEAGDRAERAFTAIVERHGPRVYRVCRGVAGDGPTAEDAFQATFLVLARKAGTLRVRESLGPWLHGVAARLAASARDSQLRRRRHEKAVAHRGEPATNDPERDPDLNRILHVEIGRLPAAYRDAVYLCDVEGLSQEVAAARLSCAIGTVRSRLCRGRKRLRSRLIRRGIVPSALVAGLASRTTAALPLRLADAAVRNALAITSGGALRGTVPAAAVALFEEGMTTMLKLKIRAMIGTAFIGLSATVAVVFAQDASPAVKPTSADPFREPAPAAKPADAPAQAKPVSSSPFGQEPATRLGLAPQAMDTLKAPPSAGDAPPNPPTEADVREALLKQKFPDMRYRLTKVGETVDPVKVYPPAGPCEFVHIHYKATICYTLPGGEVRGHEEDIFFDRDYLRQIPPERSPNPATKPTASVGRPGGSRVPQSDRNGEDRRADPAPDRQLEAERRLNDVERKLDRILKVLEKEPAQPKPNAGADQTPRAETPF